MPIHHRSLIIIDLLNLKILRVPCVLTPTYTLTLVESSGQRDCGDVLEAP